MHGRVQPPLLVALLVSVMLAGCATAGQPIEVEAPEWKSGYAWSYAYRTEVEGISQDGDEAQNFTDSEEGRFVREVFNTTLKAQGEPVYVLLQQADEGRSRFQVRSQVDLDSVPFGYRQQSICVNGDCSAGSVELQFHEDEGPEMPPYLDFPLTTGKTWGGLVSLEDFGLDTEIIVAAGVEGAARVELPMGPTQAAKVVTTTRPADMQAYEDAVRKEGEAEGFQVDALDIFIEEREVVYFSEQYQAIVRQEVVESVRFYARGTDDEGEPFEFREEFSERTTAILDGARLSALPERALDEASPYLMGAQQLVDPAGQGVVDAGYTISIDPPVATINAGAGEAAEFKVSLDGVDALPEGHNLTWSLTDSEGMTLETSGGTEFTASIGHPGRYAVSVEARQGGNLISAAAASVVADWIATSTVSCGEVTVSGLPGCDTASVPVHPGIQSLRVEAVPTGPAGSLQGTRMYVQDPLGQSIDGTASGDGFVVEVSDFSRHIVDPQPWTMHYVDSVGVLNDVEMTIEAYYSAGQSTSDEPMQEPLWQRAQHVLPW